MATLRFPLQSSRILAVLLALLHLFALFSAAVSLAGWPLVLVEAGVCLSAVGSIGEALQRWPGSALELELREDGGAAWRDRRGIWHEGNLRNSNYVSSWLLIVALAPRRLLVLLSDAAAPEDLRKLRVWLRWRATLAQNTRDAH
ncbi:MAG: hypothetical protein HY661_06530 [Betaproteobacteria bacterium]|nr:hypothetical protein [Betaproteobacteria bacterium]